MVNEPQRPVPPQRFFGFPLIATILFVAATAVWLFHGRWTIGRKDEWSITVYPAPWPLAAWWLPLGVCGLFLALAIYFGYDRFYRAKTRRAQNVSTGLTLFCLAGLTLIGPWSLLEPGGTFNLINVAWSEVSNEYFATAYQIQDVREFTRDYATERQRLTART
ncbi:MAG: hypothetical protein JOZ57_02685, partial [Abitibacteriaceae bacterium]|nr:hypothetical protein [Abditibacteriaceae bacterium]